MENITPTILEQASNIAAVNDQAQPGNLDRILVSYADRITASQTTDRPLSWIVEQIRTSEDLQKKVNSIRSEQSIEGRRKVKSSLLPYFTFLRFENGTRQSAFFKSARFILLDLDHIAEKLESLRVQMRKDPEVFMFFLSPSGDGLKVVFTLDREISTEAEYKRVYQQFRSLVEKRYAVETDDIEDVARACFLSYDPDLYINDNAARISTGPIAVQPAPQVKPKAGDSIMKALQGAIPGARTSSMTEIIGLYINKGFDREFTLEFIRSWNRANNPPHKDEKLVETVNDMYNRYDDASKRLPVKFIEKNDGYYKKMKNGNSFEESMVTSFVIKPKELLVLDENDCLVCDIKSSQGYEYQGIRIENTDWHSRQKLLKAIGHQDCVCVGSDNDLQALCAHISSLVPIRKAATKVVGLYKNMWVSEGLNITAKGISRQPEIIPYDKGSGAFYHKIDYRDLADAEYQNLVGGFYADILEINEHKVILPLLAWIIHKLPCTDDSRVELLLGVYSGGQFT